MQITVRAAATYKDSLLALLETYRPRLQFTTSESGYLGLGTLTVTIEGDERYVRAFQAELEQWQLDRMADDCW